MEYVTFDNLRSDSDLGLILARKNIKFPEMQTKYITVPGRDGVLDLSESVAGRLVYGSRPVSFDFICICTETEWPSKISAVASAIHGKMINAVCSLEPQKAYFGRWAVEAGTFTKTGGKLSISADCEPYKWDITPADNFKFGANNAFTIIEGYGEETTVYNLPVGNAEMIFKPQAAQTEFIISASGSGYAAGKYFFVDVLTASGAVIATETNKTAAETARITVDRETRLRFRNATNSAVSVAVTYKKGDL